jgi:hypothetical protein
VITTNLDVWQQEDDMVTNLFQPPRDDLLQYSHDDFRSCPEEFDAYSFEHLDLFYEENFQPSLCSNFDEGEDMVSLEKIFVTRISNLRYYHLSILLQIWLGVSFMMVTHLSYRVVFNLWLVVGLSSFIHKINKPLVGGNFFL